MCNGNFQKYCAWMLISYDKLSLRHYMSQISKLILSRPNILGNAQVLLKGRNGFIL